MIRTVLVMLALCVMALAAGCTPSDESFSKRYRLTASSGLLLPNGAGDRQKHMTSVGQWNVESNKAFAVEAGGCRVEGLLSERPGHPLHFKGTTVRDGTSLSYDADVRVSEPMAGMAGDTGGTVALTYLAFEPLIKPIIDRNDPQFRHRSWSVGPLHFQSETRR